MLMKTLCPWCFDEITREDHHEFGRLYHHGQEFHFKCLIAKMKAGDKSIREIIVFKERQ